MYNGLNCMHLFNFVKITQLFRIQTVHNIQIILYCILYSNKFQLTEILFYCDITYCCLAIFKFRVSHFNLFCLVLLTFSNISMQVSIEMHDGQYVPTDTK